MDSAQKIKEEKKLKKIVQRLRRKGKRIVFTNGCFDILHYGHIKYLESAKGYGDVLIVAVNSDSSVRKLKGKSRPINNQTERTNIVASLGCVDYVTVFKEPTPYRMIKNLKPDYLIKGADWKKEDIIGRDIVASYGGKVGVVPFIKNYSTTDLIRKIIKKFSK